MPISLIYAFFSPDFYKKTLVSFWILFLIASLNFVVCFCVSLVWTKLKVVSFSFIFYYPVILFSLTVLLLTYPLNYSENLLILRVFLLFLSVLLIIPSLMVKKKVMKIINKSKFKQQQFLNF
ncbi:hypothetical protein MFC_01365 [Mesomycoplasma flocculare ATCC 27716]|nr:hypothetical protein MFC_01365 [Mesomycoplasma flocculare ATCC 27716]